MPDEEITQTESQDVEAEEADESQELWEKVAPDLAEHIKDLTPEAREGILLKRLAASSEGKPSSGEEQPSEKAQSRKPSAAEVPIFDVDKLVAAATKALEEGDVKGWGDSVRETFSSITKLAVLVHDAQEELQEKMDEMYNETIRPSRIRKEIPNVPGATDADIAEAESIYDSGDATTPIAALSLAVFKRQQETGASRKVDTGRRTAGVTAGRTSGASRVIGQPTGKLPRSMQDVAAMLRRNAEKN